MPCFSKQLSQFYRQRVSLAAQGKGGYSLEHSQRDTQSWHLHRVDGTRDHHVTYHMCSLICGGLLVQRGGEAEKVKKGG